MKSSLTLVAQPQDFFRELVTEALGKQNIKTFPETEVYLVNLLNQFMVTERLYTRDADGHARSEPLALMFKEAIEMPQAEQQKTLLRNVGDVSLYVAGFFQDSLNRKLVDVDYYIDMGGNAYKQVAQRVEENIMKALYLELAGKFSRFVEVLAEISDRTTLKSEKDLLRMYELWVRTRSDRAARALQNAGIIPNATIKKDYQ